MLFDSRVNSVHQANGFYNGHNDLLIVDDIACGHNPDLPIFEPLFAVRQSPNWKLQSSLIAPREPSEPTRVIPSLEKITLLRTVSPNNPNQRNMRYRRLARLCRENKFK